jgi:hypothetical protein
MAVIVTGVTNGRKGGSHPLRGGAFGGSLVVEPVQDSANLLVFLQHHRHGFFLIQRDLASTFAVRVVGQRLLQFLRQSEIFHDQTARLVFENPVHPRDSLPQTVPLFHCPRPVPVQKGLVKDGR